MQLWCRRVVLAFNLPEHASSKTCSHATASNSQGVTLLPALIFNAHPLLLLHAYCCPAMSTRRWFSELLLLKTRGLVQLQQGGAYDDVEVGLTQPGVAATASQLLTTMLTQSQQ